MWTSIAVGVLVLIVLWLLYPYAARHDSDSLEWDDK